MEGLLLPTRARRIVVLLGLAAAIGAPTGIASGCSDSAPLEPPTIAGTGTTNPSTTTTVTVPSKPITTLNSSETLRWGERNEIRDIDVEVQRPVEDPAASSREGMKTVTAEVWVRYVPEGEFGEFVAYDQDANPYRPTEVPWSQARGVGPVTGSLVYEVPSGATITRIVWTWDVFEWVNQLIWQD